MMQTRQSTLRGTALGFCATACLLTMTGGRLHAQDVRLENKPLQEKANSLSSEYVFKTGPGVIIPVTVDAAGSATGFEELIEGRIAGMRLLPDDGAPGSAFSMQIRGLRSFRGDAQPLYILDGVMLNPQRNDAVKTFWEDEHDNQMTQNTLSSINPSDIESIIVLKDAASTAIYGNAGANGVVIITTKSHYKGEAVIKWNSSVGISVMANKISMLDKQQFQSALSAANPGFSLPFTAGDGVNWQDEASRLALSHNHHVSIGGISNNLNYYLSAGFSSTEGVLKRSGNRQTTIRINLDRKIGKTGVIGARINMGHRINDMIQSVTPYGSSSMTKSMLSAMPFRTADDITDPLAENPMKWVAGYDDRSIEFSVTPMVYFEAGIIRGLRFKAVAGVDYHNKERLRWIGNEVPRGLEVEGRAGKTNFHLMAHNFDGYLTFDRLFGDHAVYARAGVSLTGNTSTDRVHEGTFFFNQDLRGKGIGVAENLSPYQTIDSEYSMLSVFADAGYTYRNKYSLGATVRTDKTFRYDKGLTGLIYYPAVRASWDISAEDFMKQQSVISALTLRAGWGKSGKQSLDPYTRNLSYVTGPDPDLEIEDGVTNYYNIRWNAVTKETGVGIDISFLKDRLSLSADIYTSKTKDDFRYYRHMRRGPYTQVYSNRGKVENKGVEIALSGKPMSGAVNWDAGFTLAYNHNKITDNGYGRDIYGAAVGMLNGDPFAMNVMRNGSSVGSLYGYRSQGIVTPDHVLFVPPFYGTRLQPGDVKLIDNNGDGEINADDMTVIGNSLPKFVLGFHTAVSYRGFSLEALFEGALKYDIANLSLLGDYYAAGNMSNLRKDTYTKAYPAGNHLRRDAVGADVVSQRIIEDGSYVRLARLTLAYDMDITKVKWISTLGFTFTAKNLFTITDYSGYNPRVNSYGYDLTRMGIDNGAYPSARTFMVGIRATF